MKTERIAITMGEPGGIGPEVIAKALSKPDIRKHCIPVIIGDTDMMREAVKLSGLSLRVKTIDDMCDLKPSADTVEVLHVRSRITKKNAPSVSSGKAVVRYVKKAVELAMRDEVSAIVTAPISKESLKLAGYAWPGHTELLAELTNTKDYAMMFASRKLKIILCTIHIPMKDVPGKIRKGLVLKTLRLAKRGTEMLGIRHPRIGVAGLNPHAGESGIIGREEKQEIIPAMQKALAEGINISGPYPPDVVFHKGYHGEFDMIVCMYHDQGLIPFKMIAFDTGVNVTVGLPLIRTSPDHGTGFDIAWKNRANPSSMIEAIKLAAKLRV